MKVGLSLATAYAWLDLSSFQAVEQEYILLRAGREPRIAKLHPVRINLTMARGLKNTQNHSNSQVNARGFIHMRAFKI